MRSNDSRPATGEQHASDAGSEHAVGRLLNGAAGALLGLVGVGALSGAASAGNASTKKLLVVGDGPGKHSYTITTKHGGSISKASHADRKDSVQSNSWNPQASGSLWHYNVDSYTYTGEVESVTCDGKLSVHFVDGGFESTTWLDVWGESSGEHQYQIDTAGGDVDPRSNYTENSDTDERGSSSENGDTADTVTGKIHGENYDALDVSGGTQIEHLGVTDGHLEFSG